MIQMPLLHRKEAHMKILIDGDSCSKITLTEKIAKQKHIPCHIYCDTSRTISSSYSDIHIVDIGCNSADMAIINHCNKNDIVITNDTGLAAMILTKSAYAVNNHGIEFTNDNITQLLMRRHICTSSKRTSGRHKQMKQAHELFQDTKIQHSSFAKTLTTMIAKYR